MGTPDSGLIRKPEGRDALAGGRRMTSIYEEERYRTLVRRIRYDDGDAANYENMLRFLTLYLNQAGEREDYEEILEEYLHWNGQLMDRCYYHMPHDRPYADLCLARQALVELLGGSPRQGLSSLSRLDPAYFATDGLAPKVHRTQDGTVYRPVSRLFLVYNFAKAFRYLGDAKGEDLVRQLSPHAFKEYEDGAHEAHDRELDQMMNLWSDRIFYPVFDRIYHVPGRGRECFLYYDPASWVSLSKITFGR